jgi:hypothetical protein
MAPIQETLARIFQPPRRRNPQDFRLNADPRRADRPTKRYWLNGTTWKKAFKPSPEGWRTVRQRAWGSADPGPSPAER